MLRISVDIKFRAVGITFGHWSEVKFIRLPATIPDITGRLYEYNNHGVHVTLDNVDNA